VPVKLRQIAHSRAGDKGDTSYVSLVVFEARHYEAVRRAVTAERVRAWFGPLVAGPVERYELPQLGALNFVIAGALGGGVTRSAALDPHGKSRSALLLEMEIELDG
jgi:hypothetical protein